MSERDRELEQLLSAWSDGALDAEGAARLSELIGAEDARARAAEFVRLHALLHWKHGRGVLAGGEVRGFESARQHPSELKARTAWLLAMAVAAACVLWLSVGWGGGRTTSSDVLARIVRVVNATWASGAPASVVRVDDRLELREGLAEIQFASGAIVLLQAPVAVAAATASALQVFDGRVSVALDGDSDEFRVDTPHSRVIDRGTEFAVAVDSEAQVSKVYVFDGIVDVEPTSDSAPQKSVRLGASESVTVSHDGEIAQVEVDYREFVRRLPFATDSSGRVDRRDVHTWNTGDGRWHDASNWREGAVPDRRGSARMSRGSIIEVVDRARAGEIVIGQAALRVTGGQLVVRGRSGNIDMGYARPDAALELDGGDVVIGERLILRRSAAVVVRRGELVVGSDLFFVDGGARLELVGEEDALPVRARNLFGLHGDDAVEFVIGEHGARALVVERVASIGGRLQLTWENDVPRADQVLIEVTGDAPLTGRFTNFAEGAVVHEFADGAALRLTYAHALAGRANNDVVLRYGPR